MVGIILLTRYLQEPSQSPSSILSFIFLLLFLIIILNFIQGIVSQMEQKRSLTPAQIQYLRIGPKVVGSTTASRVLQQTLSHYHTEGAQAGVSLSNISKFTFGNFENTVSNFGVLLHRNFVGSSTLQQAQKFGPLAARIDRQMQQERDRPADTRRATQRKSLSDNRTAVKAIFDFHGAKLLLTLRSFAIESVQTHRSLENLQLPFLRLLVNHVPSSKLVKAVESAMRQEGATLTIDYEKMEGKVGHGTNNEAKYQEVPYLLERGGQQLAINLPYLELLHSESEYRQNVYLENSDIIDILDSDFDNVQHILKKYYPIETLEQQLGKTGFDRSSIPQEDD